MHRTAHSSRCGTRVRDWIRRALSSSSTHSTRPSPLAWAWDYRSAVRSSKRTGDGSGLRRTYPRGPRFSSPSLGRPRRDSVPAKHWTASLLFHSSQQKDNDGAIERRSTVDRVSEAISRLGLGRKPREIDRPQSAVRWERLALATLLRVPDPGKTRKTTMTDCPLGEQICGAELVDLAR